MEKKNLFVSLFSSKTIRFVFVVSLILAIITITVHADIAKGSTQDALVKSFVRGEDFIKRDAAPETKHRYIVSYIRRDHQRGGGLTKRTFGEDKRDLHEGKIH